MPAVARPTIACQRRPGRATPAQLALADHAFPASTSSTSSGTGADRRNACTSWSAVNPRTGMPRIAREMVAALTPASRAAFSMLQPRIAHSAVVICRPYQQRRAYATFQAAWPELDVVCSSRPLSLPDYIRTIGDARFVIDMIVGDAQRVIEYPAAGFSTDQTVPERVAEAYHRLVDAGFTSRLIPEPFICRPGPAAIHLPPFTRNRPLVRGQIAIGS